MNDDDLRDEGDTVSVSAATHARPAPSSAGLARGEVLDGRYEIQKELGRGAAAQVYQAYDRATKSAVALKVMFNKDRTDRPWRERLGRELRLAREVRHPNVCEVHDLGEAGGHRFLTMALATRGTLRDSLQGQSSTAERLADLRGVISGLAALHAAGIVHRDVKPENVLRMEDGRVVLSDFGLAVAPERVTVETNRVGTPAYMAPELLAGEPGTMRSDVWALGIVIYEAIFGARPDRSGDPGRDQGRSTLRQRRVKRALRALCARCLQPDPAERPADAREVLAAFDRSSTGPLRSRPWLVAAAALLVAALAISRVVGRPSQGIRQMRIVGRPGSLVGHVRPLASFPGRVHCLSVLPDGSLGLIWGTPRRAERVLPETGARSPWELPPESYQFASAEREWIDPKDNNCPQIAPDGRRLLFSGTSESGQRSVLLSTGPGTRPAFLSGGDLPVWHPHREDLIALRVDYGHVGIFNLHTRQLSVLPDVARPGPRGMIFILQMVFADQGRSLLVRFADEGGYNLVRYEMERYQLTERLFLPIQERLVRPRLGATVKGRQILEAMLPDGSYALAGLDGDSPQLRWLGHLPGLDIVLVEQSERAGPVLVARRATTELEVLRGVKRTIRLDRPPLTGGDVDAAGNVVVDSTEAGGSGGINFYPVGEDKPRRIGHSPLQAWPRFTADGGSVVFVEQETGSDAHDTAVRCTLDSDCRVLARAPSLDVPALSPRGDRLAFIEQLPYQHVTVTTMASGATQILAPALLCPPRWLGEELWIAQGSKDSLEWVELDTTDGHPTGRRVAGRPGCGAAGPGPENVLEDRLREIDHEDSQLMAWDGQVSD